MQHGPLVAAFSSSAVAYSSLLIGGRPSLQAFVVAFVTCLLFFLQLRIADEFKDAEEDAKFRPYRPVPRGLIQLRELGVLFALGALVQALMAWFLEPWLLVVLAIAWAYLALMSVEFFARDWLKARPITYLWTHMLIMPIVDFFATACHWLPEGRKPWLGLGLFLGASFFNGIVIEVGRKLRQPEAEEEGVPTYSRLWGLKNASLVWIFAMLTTAAFAIAAAWMIGFSVVLAGMLALVFLWGMWIRAGWEKATSKQFELVSGVWTLILYLGLGLLPLFLLR